MARPFWKYHGLGNDFVLIDHRQQPDLAPVLTRAVCARHTGVGADGILAWRLGTDGRPFMRVFNADGSVADMCGNGLRCFVRWLIDDMGYDAVPMVIDTDAGPQNVSPVLGATGAVTAVSVNLGPPRFAEPVSLDVGGSAYAGHDVFLGNPHFVIGRAPKGQEEVVGVGPHLSAHAHFPRGTNVEWLRVRDRRHADVHVFERGVGPTLACGTGGGGAVAVGVQQGLLDADADIRLTQPGGTMTYRVAADLSAVWMTGPAERVFQGQIALLPDRE